MIQSMTGFATRTFNFKTETYKIELKSLNHRFLDLKLRIPRSLNFVDSELKAVVEKNIKRGSVDVWVERQIQNKSEMGIHINEENALAAFTVLDQLRKRLQLAESVSLRDLITFPEVIEKVSQTELSAEDALALTSLLLQNLSLAVQDLVDMRASEGAKLKRALLEIIGHFKHAHAEFRGLRNEIQSRASAKIKKRIEQCFEAYFTPDEKLRALMESRIAQEISYTLEKLDIEEELTRFKGHVDLLEALLNEGGQVGKKLDFMFQELGREINTLGNKSQDLGVSQEVIRLKTWIEQMREQSLNLE